MHEGRRTLWLALGLCLALRVIPLLLWPAEPCVRDECTYLKISESLARGDGMIDTAGWLWAPGYPFLVSLHERLVGWGSVIKLTQVFVALANTALLWRLARCALRDGTEPGEAHARRAADIAALLYATSPSLAFYAISVWSETIYTTLLLGALLALLAARDHVEAGPRRALGVAAGAGALLGACVLFRGVATYMLPFFAAGLLWGRARRPRALAQLAALALAAGVVVAPYSLTASREYDAPIVSDRTLGQMMWLGNNGFDPVSFDYGNGVLSPRALDRHTDAGRPHCASERDLVARDDCERAAGFAWIRMYPLEFARRIPVRVAQLLTPHSLLTRHLRWGNWQGMPQPLKEAVILGGALSSLTAVLLGALGLVAWGRGAASATISGLLLYHVAAIAALAGLSRYRAPLEPLLMVFAGAVLADLAGTRARLTGGRRWLAIVGMCALVPLCLWYLPAGWTWWRSW